MGNGQDLFKFFTRCPNLILYGLPQLSIQDKWALIALVGICWDRSGNTKTLKELEGPYKLSLRDIEAITGVNHNALRRTEGKDPRDGVLDRLQVDGWVTVIDGKPVNKLTGNLGRTQTYLYIHLEKLWNENLKFFDIHQIPSRLVNINDFVEVVEGEIVHVVNSITVHHVTNDVHPSANKGSAVTNDVHGANVDVPRVRPNKTFKTNEDAETTSSLKKLPTVVPPWLKKGITEITKIYGGGEQIKTYEERVFPYYRGAREKMNTSDAREIFEQAISEGKNMGMEHLFIYLDNRLKHLIPEEVTN